VDFSRLARSFFDFVLPIRLQTIMSTADIPKIEAGTLFKVDGLVAVITGAGSGE
jgi:hypothetical protein